MNPSSYLEDMVSTPVYMIRYNELSKMLNTQHKSVVCNTRIINHPIASAFITIQWCSRRSEHTSAVGSLITQLQPKSPSPTSSLPPHLQSSNECMSVVMKPVPGSSSAWADGWEEWRISGFGFIVHDVPMITEKQYGHHPTGHVILYAVGTGKYNGHWMMWYELH